MLQNIWKSEDWFSLQEKYDLGKVYFPAQEWPEAYGENYTEVV